MRARRAVVARWGRIVRDRPKEGWMNRKMLAGAILLWMCSMTAQADCAVLGPWEDPCAGPVLGPTTCVCER